VGSFALLAAALACGGSTSSGPAPSAPAGDGGDASASARPPASEQKAHPEHADAANLDVQKVNEPGQEVDVAAVLVPGKVTVVEFFATWCAPCREVEAKMLAMMANNDGVALRKVDIGEDTDSSVARQHEINAVPSVRIYDRDGVLRYSLHGKQAKQAAELATHMSR